MFDQAVRILLHLKEIGVFLGLVHFTAAYRTVVSIHDLRSSIECLALSAVQAVVLSQINIALIIELLEDLLYLALMILIRCADKAVIGSVHKVPQPLDLTGYIVDKFLGRLARNRSSGLDLLTMLITSCLEVYVITVRSLISGDTVCQNDLIGVSNMRFAGRVGNRCCNVILSFILHRFQFPSRSLYL